MSKKIVAFVGSPHTYGNISTAINQILEGAKNNKSECITYNIDKLNIGYCRGCFVCNKTGGICVIKDDMQGIIEQLKEADIVIIGSPIYICQVSAQVKTLMDRLYVLTDEKHNPLYGSKKLIMLYTYGAPIPYIFNKYIKYNGNALKYMGLKLYKNIAIYGCYERDKVKRNRTLLKKLNSLGVKISK
ncbi:MAG: flavodoxin family protein [Clostridia bacterium]|nr:flavodoxin family protein [Clostridia bacterium]